MSVFDDVVVNAKSAANAVGKKAGQIIDISKLHLMAADVNGDLSKRYEALGRLAYHQKKGELPDAEKIVKIVAEIDELIQQLEDINAQLMHLRNKTECPSCGAENPADAMFCNKCGKKIEKSTEEKNEDETR